MKIKAVCEATGLTDRTIRYYIEEGIIYPEYTENYLGRKTFDFSQTDIDALQEIAVLRKFGFSIAEIKEILQHPENIKQIVDALRVRKQKLIEQESAFLDVLSHMDYRHTTNVSALVAFLSTPVAHMPIPAQDASIDIFDIVDAIRTISQILSVCHVIFTMLTTLLGIFFFPFFLRVFTQLDTVSCLTGTALGVAMFPESGSVGFITPDNCHLFFWFGFAAVLVLVVVLILYLMKKRFAALLMIGIYAFDIVFLLIHHFFLPDMLNISVQYGYTVLSALYKALGILFLSTSIWPRQ